MSESSMSDPFNYPIFVLGPPRSGTSLIAGLLHVCGAWTGRTVMPDAENPRGFFEHIYIRERVVKPVLEHLGCDRLGVGKLPPVDANLNIPDLAETIRGALEAEGYGHDAFWLYKEPKLALIWAAFANSFPNARWVVVNRDRESVVDSCLRTSFLRKHSGERAHWEGVIAEYERRIERLKCSNVSFAEIETRPIISGQFDALQALVQALGLTYRQEAVRDFVLPGAWHGRTA